ncbi:hypothetical protein L6452_04421 [Arctium lappa]|uniref:Uncharacterized protein n=1 Tax=Arctium lappa TaxID=4217 RepID=A0ACB9FR56_ARCLA|nr:hypothetical protein L6452_04421 [Arctium lappa]
MSYWPFLEAVKDGWRPLNGGLSFIDAVVWLVRGAVRLFPKGSSSCLVELTVSYEVPQLLTLVASALQPFLENLLGRRGFARTYHPDSA